MYNIDAYRYIIYVYFALLFGWYFLKKECRTNCPILKYIIHHNVENSTVEFHLCGNDFTWNIQRISTFFLNSYEKF